MVSVADRICTAKAAWRLVSAGRSAPPRRRCDGQPYERRQFGAEGAQAPQPRQGVDEALHLIHPCLGAATLRDGIGVGRGLVVALDHEAGVFGGEGIYALSLLVESRQILLELEETSRSLPWTEERLRFRLHGPETGAEIGQTGGCGKQQMTEIALAGEDAFSTGL